jgi:hypothetical protein
MQVALSPQSGPHGDEEIPEEPFNPPVPPGNNKPAPHNLTMMTDWWPACAARLDPG